MNYCQGKPAEITCPITPTSAARVSAATSRMRSLILAGALNPVTQAARCIPAPPRSGKRSLP
jgi:hypothetical protein